MQKLEIQDIRFTKDVKSATEALRDSSTCTTNQTKQASGSAILNKKKWSENENGQKIRKLKEIPLNPDRFQ